MGEKRVASEALDSHLSACCRMVSANMFRMPGQSAASSSQRGFLNLRLAPPVGPLPAGHPQQAVGSSRPDTGPVMGYYAGVQTGSHVGVDAGPQTGGGNTQMDGDNFAMPSCV